MANRSKLSLKWRMILWTTAPIIIFAIIDQMYWSILSESFVENSWYLFAIALTASNNNQTYIFPNAAFILFATAVICLNVAYYKWINKHKNNLIPTNF